MVAAKPATLWQNPTKEPLIMSRTQARCTKASSSICNHPLTTYLLLSSYSAPTVPRPIDSHSHLARSTASSTCTLFFWCLLFCSDRILYPRPGYTQSPALIVQRLVQVPLSVFQPPPPPLPHSPPHQAQRPKQRNSRRPFQLPTTSVQTDLIILFPSLAASTRIY